MSIRLLHLSLIIPCFNVSILLEISNLWFIFTSRHRHLSRTSSESRRRGPWAPFTEGAYGDAETSEPPRLRFKKTQQDTRYGGASQQRYDRYYYQQRDGGGPERHERQHYGVGPVVGPKDGDDSRKLRKYKGPNKRYRSPSRDRNLDDSVNKSRDNGLGLDDHEPLSFPDDQRSLRKDFLPTPPSKAGSSRTRNSPGNEPTVFSPEGATPASAKQRRRSKMRFEPY